MKNTVAVMGKHGFILMLTVMLLTGICAIAFGADGSGNETIDIPVVTDANGDLNSRGDGIASAPTLKLGNFPETINRYLGITNQDEADHGVISWNWLTSADIEDYQTLRSELTGEPEWTVTQISGQPLPITWNVDMDGARADVRLEAQDLVDWDIQPGTAEIRITCTWDDQTANAVTEVNLIELSSLPNGIDYNNGSDVVKCRIGDTLDIRPTVSPAGWEIPGYTPVAYAGNSGEFEAFCDVDIEDNSGKTVTVP